MTPETLTLSLGATTALVWVVTVTARIRVFHLVLAAVLAAVFLNAEVIPSMSGMAPARMLLLLMVGVYVWRRFDGRIEPLRLTRVDTIGFALLAIVFASAAGIGFAPQGDYPGPVGRLVYGFLVPMVLYWITRNAFNPEQDSVMLVRVMLVLGIYLGFTGLLEQLRLYAFVFPPYIGDPSLGLHFGRVRGPFLQSASMGMWLTFGLVAVYCLWYRLGPKARTIALAGTVAMLISIAFTVTRAAWVGVAVSTVTIVWLNYRGWKRATVLIGMAVCVVVIVVAAGDQIKSPTRYEYPPEDAAVALESRGALAYIGWEMFKDKPLFGHGFGHYPLASREYIGEANTTVDLRLARGLEQHSTFMGLMSETGLVGLGLFIALVIGWTWWGVRILKHPSATRMHRMLALFFLGCMATFATQMLTHETGYSRYDTSLIAVLAGAAAATYAWLNRSAPSQGDKHASVDAS